MNKKISINSAFGQILASYRKLKDFSQEEFEGTAHRTYISDLERGLKSPTLEMICKLAAKLRNKRIIFRDNFFLHNLNDNRQQ